MAEVPSMVPLVSLSLTGAEVANNAPQCSGCPNTGTGGRNAQLEKIGSALQSKPQTNKCKGMTSLGPNVPVNPQAPEPHHKGRKNSSKVAVPPPYSSLVRDAPDASAMDITITGPSFASQQPGGRSLSNVLIMLSLSSKLGTLLLSSELRMLSLSSELEMLLPNSMPRTLSLKIQWYCQGSKEDSDSKGSSSDDSNNKDADREDNREDNGEDDKEEGENDDIVNSSQEFGWGEAGWCQKEHLGFLEDALPLQLPQNKSSQGPPDISPGLQWQQSQHIECHHKKNRKPHLPDPESLELLNQVTESNIQLLRTKRSKSSGGRPTPDQLSWYGLCWKRFLEDAKSECCTQHALENLFPTLVKNLPGTITEGLIADLVMWDANRVWPEQKFNMSQLLYDDPSTWRSDLKKTAISITPVSYSLVPPFLVPVQEHGAWIEHAAAELITELLFLWFGFNCVLNGLAKNGHGKSYPIFSTKDYSPIYHQMLKLLKDILDNAHHGPRLAAVMNLDGVVKLWFSECSLLGNVMGIYNPPWVMGVGTQGYGWGDSQSKHCTALHNAEGFTDVTAPTTAVVAVGPVHLENLGRFCREILVTHADTQTSMLIAQLYLLKGFHVLTLMQHQFSTWATACLGPSPGFELAWAHGSGLKYGGPKHPPGQA
ncbi:hypothetical protein EDB19DRAFT_1835664 [Suillus lakei]|nr:hypothetical protein EDB19DRAFT_1835664 [Suillus lakei]